MKSSKVLCILALAFLVFTSCSAGDSLPPPRGSFSGFEDAYRTRGRDSVIFATGVFDLKSICLNFRPHTKVSGDCKAFFSEHAGVGADSQEVSLKVCQATSTSCIDPLPENAPPEVIVIRDSNGDPIEPWSTVDIQVEVSKSDRLTGLRVLTIN